MPESQELALLRDRVAAMAVRMGNVREEDLPTYGASDDDGRPHVEVFGGRLHWVVKERGVEGERIVLRDVEDAVFKIMSDAAFAQACTWELEHRIEGQDFRRLLFDKQCQLMARVRGDWEARQRILHAKILKDHPFQDGRSASVALGRCMQLVGALDLTRMLEVSPAGKIFAGVTMLMVSILAATRLGGSASLACLAAGVCIGVPALVVGLQRIRRRG